MDHLSQIQSYVLAITKLMTKTVEKLQGTQLSPIQASALSDVYKSMFACVRDPSQVLDPNSLSLLVKIGLEKWKESADESITAALEIFARIAEADLLMAALPVEFASEEEQLREIAALKLLHEQEEKRLRLAEADAVFCKQLLRDVLEEHAVEGSKLNVDYLRSCPLDLQSKSTESASLQSSTDSSAMSR